MHSNVGQYALSLECVCDILNRPSGGGYDDQEVANITLAWMISQLEQYLDFNDDYIKEQYKDTKNYYLQSGQEIRPWSFGTYPLHTHTSSPYKLKYPITGEVYNSSKGVYMLGGTTTRTPGMYTRMDSQTGRPTSKPLRDTNEYIHPSVRARTELGGPGVEDRGAYDSRALWDYTLKVADARAPGEPLAVWESRARKRDRPRKILAESPLWETERRLLGYSPDMEDYVLEGRKPPGR